MSVQTKMTAIADKIRALLGTTGAMGLDEMATNLAAEQSNLANAFSAVSGKGGTVPSAQISANLASAIESIPEGVTVQKATGTIKTNYSGAASVSNLGFKPDIVAFDGGTDPSGGMNHSGAMFTEEGTDTLSLLTTAPSTNYTFTLLAVTRSTSGFSITAQKLSTSFSLSADTNRSFSYTALKYT